MKSSGAFHRSIAMMASIAAAMAAFPVAGVLQRNALDAIGPYESRGKGRGSSGIGRNGGHKAAVRASIKARNARRAK